MNSVYPFLIYLQGGIAMKRVILLLLLIALSGELCSIDASAAGFGFYGSFGAGSANWSPDSGPDFKKDTRHLGFGLALDTAPARDRLFNYQLNIGYERASHRNSNAWGNADFDCFVISNDFGFGTLITPTTRLWFGPEVRVEWADGSASISNYKIQMFGLGIGPVIGINFNIGDSQTFVVKAGYLLLNHFAEGDGFYSPVTNTVTTYSTRYDYDVSETMAYVTLEFLFRTSDDRR